MDDGHTTQTLILDDTELDVPDANDKTESHMATEDLHRKRAKECITRLQTWTEELSKTLPHIVTATALPKHATMMEMISTYFSIFIKFDDENQELVDHRTRIKDYGDTFLLNKHLTFAVFEELALEKKENINLRKVVRQMVREGQMYNDMENDAKTQSLKTSLETMVQLNDRMKAQQIKMSADIFALLQQQKILDQHIENTEAKLQKMAADNSRYKHMVDHLKTKRVSVPVTNAPSTVKPHSATGRPRDDIVMNIQPRPPTSNGMSVWSRSNKLALQPNRSRPQSVRQQRTAVVNDEETGGLFVSGLQRVSRDKKFDLT